MRKSPDNNDNIENQHQEQESSIDNSELIETRNDQYKLEEEKEKQSETQLTNAERLKQKLMGWDTDETFSNFSKYINYIKDNWQPKDISKELEFLKDSQYIEQTKKEYKEMFEKTKKLLGETDILSKISEISNIKEKWWDVTNNIQDLKRQKVFKNIVKLQKYERWEFVNFPNWISFELCKWKIPWWDATDYYIQTHVEKNTKYYIEYVDSLLNMRELFKSKWINIKYWHRETWLANREFIEAYEKIRKEKKESEWETYEKSNILKVLEQTKQAVIFEKEKKIKKDKKDNEQGKKSINGPIRFIKENTDLHDFATGKGKDLFYEREMWLDLDKLSYNGKNLRQKSNIWKAKLKIQEFFVKLKKFFAKK